MAKVTMTLERFRDLEDTLPMAGYASADDALDDAVWLFKAAVEQAAQGRVIVALDLGSNKYHEFSLPSLTYAERKGHGIQ